MPHSKTEKLTVEQQQNKQVAIWRAKRVRLTDELTRLQNMQGSGFGKRLPRMNRIADEIATLTQRIVAAESKQTHDQTDC